MKTERIDHIELIDLSSVTLTDLRWLYGTGISTSTGTGKHKVRSYRLGVMTELGDIEEGVWYQAVKQVAERDQEEWAVEALLIWHQEHNYQGDTLAQLRCKALESYSSRIWEQPRWVDYIPFNRRFSPHVLEHAHIVTVVSSCCGKPGEVTQEQIDHAWGGQISCPYCGQWSSFTVQSVGEGLPWVEFLVPPPTEET